MKKKKIDLLQRTLDLLVLKALALEPSHGSGISHGIRQMREIAFQMKPGFWFSTLHRIEEAGLLESTWGESENNRRTKFYELTEAEQRQFEVETESWQCVVLAMTSVPQIT